MYVSDHTPSEDKVIKDKMVKGFDALVEYVTGDSSRGTIFIDSIDRLLEKKDEIALSFIEKNQNKIIDFSFKVGNRDYTANPMIKIKVGDIPARIKNYIYHSDVKKRCIERDLPDVNDWLSSAEILFNQRDTKLLPTIKAYLKDKPVKIWTKGNHWRVYFDDLDKVYIYYSLKSNSFEISHQYDDNEIVIHLNKILNEMEKIEKNYYI